MMWCDEGTRLDSNVQGCYELIAVRDILASPVK